MSDWFSKAKKALKPAEAEAAQPFQLTCECGQEHSGLRRLKHQHLTCKTCGRSVFVLPRDVYPQPVPVTEKKTKATPSGQLDDPPRNGPASISTLRKRTRGKAPLESAAASPTPKAAKPSPQKSAPKPERSVPRKGVALPPQRFWTPFRIVGSTVLIIGICTTWWMIRQARMSAAAERVRVSGAEGLAIIEQGEWDAARKVLGPVAEAIDQLGRRDAESIGLLQYFNETRAMTNLCADSLDTVFAHAVQERLSRNDKEKNHPGLVNHYLGQWVVIEGVVQDVTPPKTRRRRLEMTFPGRIPQLEGEAAVQVNFPAMLNIVPKEGEQAVIFAGAIKDCEFDEKSGRLILQLDPTTGFLWTHLDTWLGAGFEFDSARTKEVVEQQLALQRDAIEKAP